MPTAESPASLPFPPTLPKRFLRCHGSSNGKQNDFQNNELYGDLALGSVSNKNMTIDIASLSVFSDTLPDAEIQKISQK